MEMSVSVAIGLIIIIAGGWDDFRRNIRKSKHRWQFYMAGGIFTAIHVFMYMQLVRLVAIPSTSELEIGHWVLTGEALQIIAPIVLAMSYYAAGAGIYRLGSKEFQFNRFLIGLLQNMFSYHQLVSDKIRYTNETAEEIYNALRLLSKTVRFQSKFSEADSLKENWESYLYDEAALKGQIRNLETIDRELGDLRGQLAGNASAINKLEAMIQGIRQRIGVLRQEMIRKLQKFLVAFAFKNYRDDARLEDFLVEIKVLPPSREECFQTPNIITRSMVMGFMFGLTFGPIFYLLNIGDATQYCFLGATALMLFTGLISFGIHTGRWHKTFLWASVGGYLAHLHWIIASLWLAKEVESIQPGAPPSGNSLVELFSQADFWLEPIKGMCFGVITAVLLFALKYRVGERFERVGTRYLSAALAGLPAYFALYLIFFGKSFEWGPAVATGLIGGIVMVAMAMTVNVGNRKTTKAVVRSLTPSPG